MRFYRIEITEQDGSPITDVQGKQVGPFTSLMEFNAVTNLAALNVYLDLPVATYDAPMGGALVRIWGLPLYFISQASNFNGKRIVVYGGMSAGLPLANPAQQGLLVEATIQQSFGNWQGTNQTLDMYIRPSDGGQYAPRNIILNWKNNTKLADAIKFSLNDAFKTEINGQGYKVSINISNDLVAYEDMVGAFQSVAQFAKKVKELSLDIIKTEGYSGVSIILVNKTFIVYDGTESLSTQVDPTEIEFKDFIGQPTWFQPGTIAFKTVMRGDINLGDYIKFPTQTSAYQLITSGSQAQARQRSAFTGVYQIQKIRHLGEFRQRGGDNWVTVFEATPESNISV